MPHGDRVQDGRSKSFLSQAVPTSLSIGKNDSKFRASCSAIVQNKMLRQLDSKVTSIARVNSS